MQGKGETGVQTGELGGQKLTDVKSSSNIVQKKMVQARLPFKRLNPVPRDNEVLLQGKKQKMDKKVSSGNTMSPVDPDVENGGKIETEKLQSLPKVINGRGPLDNYIKKVSKTCHVVPSVTIDLTEDSNSAFDHPPIIDSLQSSLENGFILTDCDRDRSKTVTETGKVLKDVDGQQSGHVYPQHSVPAQNVTYIGKKAPLTVHTLNVPVHETTEMLEEYSNFTEEFLGKPSDCTTIPSPMRTISNDADRLTEESCTPLSSSNSPSSSPEALTGSLLKTNNASPTGILKEKEQDIKRRKLQAEKERDRVKEELKLAKERAKEEAKKKKDDEKEQKAKEKREKKEKEDRERAEKLRLKEEKKKEKLEALEAKQEEKRKKEEEKRMREEEKRVKEEEKRMKAEKAEITRFLHKSKTSLTPKLFARSCGKFAPFEIKKNMAIAPLCRVEFEPESSEQLDTFLKEQKSEINFLFELKARKPHKMGRTVIPEVPPQTSDTEEVQILIENESNAALQGKIVQEECAVPERKMFGKMKLLQFSENHRPAYWGTWNRSSTVICPRKPWAQDTALLDYDVDSDDEWEEEEPGESLSHSEGEDEEDDPKEDDDDDDGFFVPHGYLSEDEGGVSDEECKNPENQKVRQRLKAKEWDELQSKGKKINVLKPVVIGCTWMDVNTAEMPFLQKFAACILDTVNSIEEDLVQEYTNRGFKDREILMHLLPLLHGNVNGSKIIIQEFQECCRRGLILLSDYANVSVTESASPNSRHQTSSSMTMPSKARLKRIISENSVYEKRPEHRMCWYVHTDILKSFQQESLPVPCQWVYVTQVNLISKDETGNSGGLVQATPSSGKRKSAGSMPITKFMKKATEIGSGSDVGVCETDGFQADTEEDDEDDYCMIVEEHDKKDTDVSSILCKMEVTLTKEPATA